MIIGIIKENIPNFKLDKRNIRVIFIIMPIIVVFIDSLDKLIDWRILVRGVSIYRSKKKGDNILM